MNDVTDFLDVFDDGELARSNLSLKQLGKRTRFRAALSPACKQGHPWTPENTIVRTQNGYLVRICRQCMHMRKAKRNQNGNAFKHRYVKSKQSEIIIGVLSEAG